MSEQITARFYAVATNMDKIRSDPQLSVLDWIQMKSKCNFVNMRQVHFSDKQEAADLYDTIKKRSIPVFKNWK